MYGEYARMADSSKPACFFYVVGSGVCRFIALCAQLECNLALQHRVEGAIDHAKAAAPDFRDKSQVPPLRRHARIFAGGRVDIRSAGPGECILEVGKSTEIFQDAPLFRAGLVPA